ncbi:MAG: amidohydrolase family protein, partial [Selenomonadaceae bacterium]
IAGSVLTMNEAVRNLAENLGIPVWQAAECATISAARSMGMQYQAGSFEAGAAADIVFFDDDVNIYRTIVNGKTVYEG